MEQLLDRALNIARKKDELASVVLGYNPYTKCWEAEANWSVDDRERICAESAQAAVSNLVENLEIMAAIYEWGE